MLATLLIAYLLPKGSIFSPSAHARFRVPARRSGCRKFVRCRRAAPPRSFPRASRRREATRGRRLAQHWLDRKPANSPRRPDAASRGPTTRSTDRNGRRRALRTVAPWLLGTSRER